MKKKIAVIGLGSICQKAYMPILGAQKDLQLMLYNRSPEPLADTQKKYRIDYGTNNLDQLIDDQPQAAFVLTSSDSHFEIVKLLLQNDVDVFVEKPATMDIDETRILAELANEHERILMVGFNRRYAPLHIRAKTLWGENPVSMGVFRKFRQNPSFKDRRRQLYEDTIHQIDLLRFYCGEGDVESFVHESKGGKLLSAAAAIRLASGGVGIIETNLQAGAWREYYSLYGHQKTVEIEAFSKLSVTQGPEQKLWVEPYASGWQSTLAGRGFESQIKHFFDCVESREQPQTTAWDSVKTQELTEAIIDKLV
jgi:virulence factor